MACAKYTYSWKCIDNVAKCVQNGWNQVVNNSFCDWQDIPLCGGTKTILVCPKIEEEYCNNNNGIMVGCFYGPALKTLSFEYKNKDYSDSIPNGIKLSVNQIEYTAYTTDPSCKYTKNEQILKFSLYDSQIKQDDTSLYPFSNECSNWQAGFTKYKSIPKYEDMQLSGMPVENGQITRTSWGTNYTLRIWTESECWQSSTPKCGIYRWACAKGTSSNPDPETFPLQTDDDYDQWATWKCKLGNLSVECTQYYKTEPGGCPYTYEWDGSACIPKAKYCARTLSQNLWGLSDTNWQTKRIGNGICFWTEFKDGIDDIQGQNYPTNIVYNWMDTNGTFWKTIRMDEYPNTTDKCTDQYEERAKFVLNEKSFTEYECQLSPTTNSNDDGFYLTCGRITKTANRCSDMIISSSKVDQSKVYQKQH